MTATVTQALMFDIPEVPTSDRMAAAEYCCEQRGIALQNLDVWTETESVRAHGLLAGPAVVLLVLGAGDRRRCGPHRHCRLPSPGRAATPTIGSNSGCR